jgi:hypothetical protein
LAAAAAVLNQQSRLTQQQKKKSIAFHFPRRKYEREKDGKEEKNNLEEHEEEERIGVDVENKACALLSVFHSHHRSFVLGVPIDYKCDDSRFWLSAHNCHVPTPTSQNIDLEQQIRICKADKLINCLED